jgi:hypothetical protein
VGQCSCGLEVDRGCQSYKTHIFPFGQDNANFSVTNVHQAFILDSCIHACQ